MFGAVWSGSRHGDDICLGQSPLSVVGGCGPSSEVTSGVWADDAGIPRWRMRSQETRPRGPRPTPVRPQGASLGIADLVNDAADSYDGRHHRRDGAVLKFDCGSLVKHDCSLRSILMVVTVSQDSVTQFRPPVEVDDQQPRDDCRGSSDQAEHPDLRRQPHRCAPRGDDDEEADEGGPRSPQSLISLLSSRFLLSLLLVAGAYRRRCARSVQSRR